jgi:EpsI family protein
VKFLDSIRNRVILTGILLLPAIIYAFSTAGNNFGGKVVVKESTLPETIGDWQGKLEPLSDTELNVLHSPSASQRIYQNTMTGDLVQVLLIQVENTQNAHDPRLCMQGSGYAETYTREEPGAWADADPKRNAISHSVFSKEGRDLHMYYWMSTKEGTVANMSSGLKLEGMLRALRGDPTRGVAVRILGRPNAFEPDKTTDPETLKKLWQQIREQVKVEDLVAKQ